MRINRTDTRIRASGDDSLIPMINIVFLLLVFFMIAGSIKPPGPLAVTPPESEITGESTALHVLYVALDGSLALNGELLSETDLLAAIQALALSAGPEQVTDVQTDESQRGAVPAGVLTGGVEQEGGLQGSEV